MNDCSDSQFFQLQIAKDNHILNNKRIYDDNDDIRPHSVGRSVITSVEGTVQTRLEASGRY